MKHTSETVQAWLGYLHVPELKALKELAASLPKGSQAINLGAGAGTSGLALMESPNKLRVTTVDKQKDASPLGCLVGEETVFRSAGFWGDPRHKQIHDDSAHAGQNWLGGDIHLLFVDADHSKRSVFCDIYGWIDHMAPGSIIAFHDYRADGHWPEVREVVDQEMRGYEVILHVDGLRVFRVPERTLHITGYPRSGNTWANTLFRQAVGDQFRIRKSHQRRDEFMPAPDDLILHIRRDPRDVLVSIMHYRSFPLERALARLQGADGMPYLTFEASWDGAPIIGYEGLIAYPDQAVSGTLDNFQIKLSAERTVADAVSWSEFDATLQRFPERKGTMWQGKIANWRHELTRQQAQQFDKVFGAYLRAEGYADEGWWEELP